MANEEFSANGYTAADVSVTLIFADVDHTQYKDDLNLTADAIGLYGLVPLDQEPATFDIILYYIMNDEQAVGLILELDILELESE